MSQIAIPHELIDLIEAAAKVAGSQMKLAALLDTTAPTLIQMKQGKRPANWRVRGKLRAVLGEDPAHAFMAAMAEDLSTSENEDEKKAADGFKTMLAAFSDGQEKSPTDQIDEALSWRKRKFATPPAARLTGLFYAHFKLECPGFLTRYRARLTADSETSCRRAAKASTPAIVIPSATPMAIFQVSIWPPAGGLKGRSFL